jgi:16S rRNA (uracil1498-N3)-methyltransferase
LNIFFTPGITDHPYELPEEESRHIIRVLRFIKGDCIFLTNGKGDFSKAEILVADPKACVVKITETTHEFGKRNYKLHIGIAPTKNIDRFEWFLEKATEIGVDEITPVICNHSERRELKVERLNKVIVSALKQSVKAYLPQLHQTMQFNDFVSAHHAQQNFICYVDADKSRHLKDFYSKEKNVLLLIGPEGDFSKDEIELAVKNHFEVVSLGASRLRTETAGIAACHTIALMNS